MKITIRYEAQARRAAGVAEETIDLPAPSTVSDCIRHVGDTHGDTLRPILLDAAGAVQRSLLIFRGDDQVARDDARELTDGETITIMTPISGG